MIFIQSEVDQIVARAKELGAGEGCSHKRNQFTLLSFENQNAFALAMVLVGGWVHREDLICAFCATIEILSGSPRSFLPDEYDAVIAHAEKIGLQTSGLPVHVPCSARLISTLLVTEFLRDKYDLIYALQALIEYCAYDHPASKRTSAPKDGGEGIFPLVVAATALWRGHCSFVPSCLQGRLAGVPELPRDDAYYKERAKQRRESKARKKADNELRTLEGKRKAATV